MKKSVVATTALRKDKIFLSGVCKQVILKRGLKVISHFAHKHLTEQNVLIMNRLNIIKVN